MGGEPVSQRPVCLTNCRLAVNGRLVRQDLWIDPHNGLILEGQKHFFERRSQSARFIDLRDRIVSPGFIDVQINGAFGVDFSRPDREYASKFADVNKKLVRTGVTSYLPTITSQRPETYHQVLPHLGKSTRRSSEAGSESLGAHCEGPFINPARNGIHAKEMLQEPSSIERLHDTYGSKSWQNIKKVTLAPELDESRNVVSQLIKDGITVSIGHTATDHETARQAIEKGARMITHLYNAMPSPHHRDISVFGLLGDKSFIKQHEFYYGLIADTVHVHPAMLRTAWTSHPAGCILVTDAMFLLGLHDGVYQWDSKDKIVKRGTKLTLNDTETIAGSCIDLLECVNNFIDATGCSTAEALSCVTEHPAEMLRQMNKGRLEAGRDADLVVLDDSLGKLVIEQVWKYGVKVFDAESGLQSKL